MGIHLSKNSNASDYPDFWSGDPNDTNDRIRHPVGLTCSDSDPSPETDVPDKLLSMWYAMPNMETCFVFGNPPNCSDTEPEAFDGPEDNTNLDSVQQAWHSHPGLCVWALNTTQAGAGEGFTEAGCNDMPTPNLWFSNYGWMLHLYNYVPNADGRFLEWSTNVPFSQ